LVKITRDELRKKIIPLSQIPLKMQTARVEEAGQKLFSRGSSVPEAYLVENKGLSLEKEVKVTTKKGELLGIGIVSIIKTGKGHKITVKPKVVLT
jgi:hypothetical protein